MAAELKIGIIGLDTSHTVAFTKQMQGDVPAEQRIDGMRVAKAMRFPSAFQSEEGQDGRQKEMEAMGVKMASSVAETVDGMDAVFLEINDPALHLKYFEQVAGLGLPVFIDKPLAGNLAEGKKIYDLAKSKGTKVWSSSSLRFFESIVAACKKVPEAKFCNVYGPLGKAAVGSDLVWYGVHTFEMMATVMGLGAKSVFVREDDCGVVATVHYGEGRRAVAECIKGAWKYGGRAQGEGDSPVENFGLVSGEILYYYLLKELRIFLQKGTIPVPMETTLEIQAIMDAAERSLVSSREEKLAL